MKITTISIDEAVHLTAHQTQSKDMRGGFSAYVEQLIREDLKNKGVDIIKTEINEPVK